MGMFDYFRSSYDLGESFTNVPCHTKDIEDGIGGTMTQYWLDPAGKLWVMTYRDTHDMEIYEKGHPNYDPKSWINHGWIPNGTHGRVRPTNLTKYITVYPEQWDGEWEDWPECRIHFKQGKLQDYEHSSKGE
jgi:hypothetical protein